MNDSHRSYLVATLKHVDELLGEARRVLEATEAASAFTWYTPDASSVQRQVARAYLDEIGRAMLRALSDLGLPRPAAVCGSLWAVRTRLAFAHVDLTDMTAARLASYGALPEAEGLAVERVAAELRAALDRLSEYLAQGSDADLLARLKALEQTCDEVPLLRELERIITAHGLVALRGTLEMLLERLETERFEIGVFGRVSSGKSSLLNHLIGTVVLPVGVTPVTAVPTSIQFGEAARATVSFAQDPPQMVDLASLRDFATEQGNPDNRRHVTRIVVEVNAPRLREGVTWVDTPGLGSLATSGAAQTTAYLPRCDLGLVLIDAGASLTQDDQLLVQALLRAGADAMVLVSKADLLGEAERLQFVDYVRSHLARQFGQSLPVYLVSVVGANASLCDAWFEQVLQPRLAAHREQAAAARRRKIGLLRDIVTRTLEARIADESSAEASTVPDVEVQVAEEALRACEGWITTAQREAEALLDVWPVQAPRLRDASAAAVVARWSSALAAGRELAADACREVLEHSVHTHGEGLQRILSSLMHRLQEALRLGYRALGEATEVSEELPRLAGQPLIDVAPLVRTLDLSPTAIRTALPRTWQQGWVRRQLNAQWGDALPAFLRDSSRALRTWVQSSLADVQRSFRATAATLTLQIDARARRPARVDIDAVRSDLRRLRDADVKKP
jgi:GTP-binding protein EngB required for normal cell division